MRPWVAIASTPNLTVDVNLIYMHATLEREIAGGFFVTGGVRRFALKYDIDFLDYDTFTSKPGIWDPLVGVAYHKVGDTLRVPRARGVRRVRRGLRLGLRASARASTGSRGSTSGSRPATVS